MGGGQQLLLDLWLTPECARVLHESLLVPDLTGYRKIEELEIPDNKNLS